jgi:hypothetical protein
VSNPAAGKVVQRLHIDRANLRKINPVSSGHTAFVYLTKRGSYVVGAGRLTMGELWLNTPKEIYAVDVSPRQETFTLSLPSQEEAFAFASSVRATWQITDPIAAVRGNVDSPEHAVRQYLEERLRELTREFEVERSADAERRINIDLGDRMVPVSPAVTVIRCTVVLSLDEATRAHIASRTLVLRDREKLDQTRQTEIVAHELDRQRAGYQHELEKLKEKHEMEMKQARVEVYAEALRSGSHHVLALRLAGHGEDVNQVIELLMGQQQMEFEGARSVLNSLLEANLLNRKDVAAIMANASNRMADHLSGEHPLSLDRAKSDRKSLPAVVVEPDSLDEDDD